MVSSVTYRVRQMLQECTDTVVYFPLHYFVFILILFSLSASSRDLTHFHKKLWLSRIAAARPTEWAHRRKLRVREVEDTVCRLHSRCGSADTWLLLTLDIAALVVLCYFTSSDFLKKMTKSRGVARCLGA